MKNRNYSIYDGLDEGTLYAIERKARAARAQEMGRLFAAAWQRVASLFHFAPAGRKAAGHA
jgi:hypothetical protein